MTMKKNIGKTFKEIRLKKKLSLKYICNGICSQASLSRFENNIGDIPLNKFLKLLNRIEISESEFFSYIDQNHDLVNSNFLDNIAFLYGKKILMGFLITQINLDKNTPFLILKSNFSTI